MSLRGSNVDLLHVLFGTVLALDDNTLLLLAAISTITLAALAMLYRPLVLECVDPGLPALGQPRRRRRPIWPSSASWSSTSSAASTRSARCWRSG